VLIDRKRITVWHAGAPVERTVAPYRERSVSEFSLNNWNEIYAQERAARHVEAPGSRRAARGR